jgi:flagellar basal-body rod modification protein FlgD
MTASPLTATTAATSRETTPASSPPAENPDGILGQNDFLKLMVAQLQAQNPLEPGNSNEYVNELAQFTDVEQITNLAQANELSSAVQMIGHKVTYDKPSGEATTGTVQSVQSSSAGTTVTVASSPNAEGESGVKLSSITNIE